MESANITREEYFLLKKEIRELKEMLLAKKKNPCGECFSIEDVAEFAGISPKTVRNDYADGKIFAKYPRAKNKFTYEDMDRYLQGKIKSKKKGKHHGNTN